MKSCHNNPPSPGPSDDKMTRLTTSGMASDNPSGDDNSASNLNTVSDRSNTSNVVTLEPYNSPSSGSYNSRKLRSGRMGKKLDGESFEISPGIFAPNNYSRFLVLKMIDGGKMREYDMFALNREINSKCKREPKISFLNDGTLLVEVSSPEDSSSILSIPSLSGSNVECMPHKSLNQVRGVIRSLELLKYSEDKLQKEFENQGVIDVKQMKKTVGGLLTPLPTYVLTFDRIKLPNFIRAAWLRLEVRPYIPTCRRCFYCQRFGHVIGNCRRKIKGERSICVQCGQLEHGVCNNPPRCINCGDAHSAASKQCNKFIFEKEVQALRAKEHLSFKEARERVALMFIKPGTTFSSLFAKSNVNLRKTTDATKNTPLVTNNTVLEDSNQTKSSTSKRRLSGDREENPSSKIHLTNSFDLLQDEMDSQSLETPSGTHTDSLEPSAPTDSVLRSKTLIPAAASEQAGPSFSACNVEQAGIHISACETDQAGNSDFTCSLKQVEISKSASVKQAKPHEERPMDQTKAYASMDSLERVDSFVSASSGEDAPLPSLEETSTKADKIKSTGTIPKAVPDTTGLKNGHGNYNSQPKVQRNFNSQLKVPKNVAEKSDNKTKKNITVGKKTKESSK